MTRPLSAREAFGIDSDLQVPAFTERDEHVPAIDPAYRIDGGNALNAVNVHRLFDDARNRRKAELAVEKSLYGHFVGRVEDYG